MEFNSYAKSKNNLSKLVISQLAGLSMAMGILNENEFSIKYAHAWEMLITLVDKKTIDNPIFPSLKFIPYLLNFSLNTILIMMIGITRNNIVSIRNQ